MERTERDYFVHLPSAAAVRTCSPNLATIATLDARGAIITVPADADDVDFVSRFFAPDVGVPEDPVTGSAHCTLGPYWAHRWNRTALTGRQVSARGGTIRVRLEAPAANRVELCGQALTTLRGRLDA